MVAPSQPFAGKAQPLDSGVKAPKKAQGGGGGQKLNALQIIQASAKRELGPQMPVEQFMDKLAKMIQAKMVQLVQIGNTVFLIKPTQPQGTVEFHTFTVEPPESLTDRFKAGSNTLKQMGFKKAISYADSPAFVKIAQSTGLPVRINQQPNPQTGKQQYRFELDL